MAEASAGNRNEKRGQSSWFVGIVLLGVAMVATWWLVNEQHKKLTATQADLAACQAKPKPICTTPFVIPQKKVHKKVHRLPHHNTVVAQKAPAKQVLTISPPQEEKFDSSMCGAGTEFIFDKGGKPYCRAVLGRSVAPIAKAVEAPKQARVICEKPLIRELRDDGSVACIQVAPPVQQATGQVLPPGCYMDGSRLMCPTQEEESSSGSWVPWVIGGAAVLGVAAILHNRNRGGGSSPPSVVISQPPVVVSQPPTFTPSPPGVNSLPPSFPR